MIAGVLGTGVNLQCIYSARNLVGECPLWHSAENALYWVDVNGFKISRLHLETREFHSWKFPAPVSAISLTTDPAWFLVPCGGELLFWSPEGDRRVAFVAPESDWPALRLNDGAADPYGYFWVGSMKNNVAPDGAPQEATGRTGTLYRISPGGEVDVADRGFGIPNTIAWSPDHGTFLCGCSVQNILFAYDYQPKSRSIGNRRIFAQDSGPGVPDGSAMDADGFLWNCRYGGGCILRISPLGRVEQTIPFPVSNITNCVFGGPGLTTLYVTTASIGLEDSEPLAGGLFSLPAPVPGLPAGKFLLTAAQHDRLQGV